MDELLRRKGLVEVAEDRVYVTGVEGPPEDGWQAKVHAFAARVSALRVPVLGGDGGG